MIDVGLWQSASEDVLSVLLTEHYVDAGSNAFNVAFYERGLLAFHLPPGKWRTLLTAIFDLRVGKKAINWNNLALIIGESVTQDWYTELITLCDATRILDFEDNLALLMKLGTRMNAVESLQDAAKALTDGKEIGETVNALFSELSSGGERRIEDETAGSSDHRLDAIFDQKPPPVIPTGLEFLDKAIGGLRKERLLVIAGAYKSSKTRLGLNFCLSAYRAGERPAVLSFENSVETTMMQIVSMLAVEWLLRDGKVAYSPEASVYWISADALMQAGDGYKAWTALKVEAINYARAELKRMADGMRFYDRSFTGGGLSNTDSIHAVVQRDMRLYGGNVFMVDHQGLVDGSGEVYEDTRSVTGALQKLSRIKEPHTIHLMALAQLNESAIANEKGYSAGVKGGGDTSANADYVLRTFPVEISDGKYFDDRTELKVKHNRWGVTTDKNTVMFHPGSGLIMPSKTVLFSDL